MNNGKLNDEVQEQICKYISMGVPNKTAAEACGISEVTFYSWIKKGKQQRAGKYVKFLKALKKAEAQAIAHHVGIIEKAAKEKSWQASAWLLERRHPDQFGAKTHQHIEHSGKIGLDVLREYIGEKDEKEGE